MIRAGFTLVSPRTQSRTLVTATDAETKGEGFDLCRGVRTGVGPGSDRGRSRVSGRKSLCRNGRAQNETTQGGCEIIHGRSRFTGR